MKQKTAPSPSKAKIRSQSTPKRTRQQQPKKKAPDTQAAEKWLTEAQQRLYQIIRKAITENKYTLFRAETDLPAIKWMHPPGGKDTDLCLYLEDQDTMFVSTLLGQGMPARFHGTTPVPEIRILEYLLHEILHWRLGYQGGHQGFFGRLSTTIGYTGKVSLFKAGPDLYRVLNQIAEKLGPFPTDAVVIKKTIDAPGHRKQKNRQLKYVCSRCGKIIRSAGEDLTAIHLCEGDLRLPYGHFKRAD